MEDAFTIADNADGTAAWTITTDIGTGWTLYYADFDGAEAQSWQTLVTGSGSDSGNA